MKKLEKILWILIIVLILARLLVAYPFSAILITFSMLILSLIYLFFSFALLNNIRFRHMFQKNSYEGISALRIIGTVFTGFLLSSIVIYALFKFQRWPYGNQGLLICLVALLVVIIVVAIKYNTGKNKFYSGALNRLILIGIFAFILFVTPSETILEITYRNFPEYVEAETKLMEDPDNEELRQQANEARRQMDMDN